MTASSRDVFTITTPAQFGCDQHSTGDTTFLRVTGDLDMASVRTFGRCVASALREPTSRLVLDLRGVSFIDSVGIGQLVDTSRQSEERRRQLTLIVQDASPVRRLLDTTRVATLFEIAAVPAAR